MQTGRVSTAARKGSCLLLLSILLLSVLSACSGSGKPSYLTLSPEARADLGPDLHYASTLELSDAERFAVDFYQEGGSLVTVSDDRRYLCLPREQALPSDLPEDVTVLRTPVERGYLAGSASMDFFLACDALPSLRFSSQKESNWRLPEAAAAMHDGTLVYAGKYSTPDYELLKTGKCGLAVENTMLYHSPEVLETLESLGIPVFIDLSSTETTPLGRMEWVRLYGLLTGHEKQADRAFREQKAEFDKLDAEETEDAPSVAYFSIQSNGTVTVRLGTDYIPTMIREAGGRYIFDDLTGEEGSYRATTTISMEEFYQRAKTADYFILNSTIEGERTSVAQLLEEAPVLADCTAVESGHVYCTTQDFYQHSMEQGTFVRDLHEMLTGGDDFTYLFQLK